MGLGLASKNQRHPTVRRTHYAVQVALKAPSNQDGTVVSSVVSLDL